MSINGSVAPKERINIVYEAATGDVKEEIELPLKLLVLGDFTFKEDGRPVEERSLIDINKNNFNDVMEGLDLNLEMTVPDRLSGEADSDITVNLKFESMKDFQPDSITQNVEELRKIIELRQALMSLKGPLGNVPAMRKTIQGIIADEESRKQLANELLDLGEIL